MDGYVPNHWPCLHTIFAVLHWRHPQVWRVNSETFHLNNFQLFRVDRSYPLLIHFVITGSCL